MTKPGGRRGRIIRVYAIGERFEHIRFVRVRIDGTADERIKRIQDIVGAG